MFVKSKTDYYESYIFLQFQSNQEVDYIFMCFLVAADKSWN
jgi:hypothetical protein